MRGLATYNFPAGNPDPFDITFPGNYFVLAQKYSNLAVTVDGFGEKAFERFIPMGRTTIIVCHRTEIFAKGISIKSWPKPEPIAGVTDIYSGQFMVSAKSPIHGNSEPYSEFLKTVDKAQDAAIRFSTEHSQEVMVSFVLYTIMWH